MANTLVDPVELILAYLHTQSDLAAWATSAGTTHLYGGGLPANWTIANGVMFIVDGGPSQEHIPVDHVGVQFRTYAPTPWGAMRGYLYLAGALLHKNASWVSVAGGQGLFQFASRQSGPHADREPQTLWPYVMSIWNVHLGQDLKV